MSKSVRSSDSVGDEELALYRTEIRKSGCRVVGSRPLPALTQLTKYMIRNSCCSLLYKALCWILCCAGGITLLLIQTACVPAAIHYWQVYMYALGSLLHSQGPPVKENGVCPAVSFVMVILGIITDACVFSILVNKLTTPQSDIVFSRNIVVKMRNGQLMLQFRQVSPYGHCLTDIAMTCHYYKSVVSLEGESYVKITAMNLECPNFGGAYALNINHIINEDSPLWGEDLTECGSFHVTCSAFDCQLQIPVTVDCWFAASSVKVGYDHSSCFIKSPREAISDRSVHSINMDKFYSVDTLNTAEHERILAMMKAMQKAKKVGNRAVVIRDNNDTNSIDETVESIPSTSSEYTKDNGAKKKKLFRIFKRTGKR
mmetsp:Transcript_16926/g.25525  ORF Transcript_16926/g.25525 Transcript_16926/m.25525 type:complete len:371 (+) Transcript_16926:100-1212(+)